MTRSVEETLSTFGRLDILVNNAGISHRNQPMLDVAEDEFDRVFAVNVKSLYLFAQAAVPAMRRQGKGMILNIGSTAGLRPRPGLTWYNGTRVRCAITKSMAVELAPERIRVCALAPVAGETPLLATFLGEDTPERRAAFRATVPLGRLSTPTDIANAALFLASDEADLITGVVLEVDGDAASDALSLSAAVWVMSPPRASSRSLSRDLAMLTRSPQPSFSPPASARAGRQDKPRRRHCRSSRRGSIRPSRRRWRSARSPGSTSTRASCVSTARAACSLSSPRAGRSRRTGCPTRSACSRA